MAAGDKMARRATRFRDTRHNFAILDPRSRKRFAVFTGGTHIVGRLPPMRLNDSTGGCKTSVHLI